MCNPDNAAARSAGPRWVETRMRTVMEKALKGKNVLAAAWEAGDKMNTLRPDRHSNYKSFYEIRGGSTQKELNKITPLSFLQSFYSRTSVLLL